jgi:hypothetical protein
MHTLILLLPPEESKQIDKVSAIFDKRDTDYFIKLLQRREEAVSEYATVQRERIKNTELKTIKSKELFDKFDCVPTPAMHDFEVTHSNKQSMMELVKKICLDKKFKVYLAYESKG